MKAKSLSPEEKLVSLIVSSSRGVCTKAYIRSIAELYFLFARANYGASGSIGQDSSDCSVFELRCRASNTRFMVSPLGIMIRGFKYVVPYNGLSCGEEPICSFISFIEYIRSSY